MPALDYDTAIVLATLAVVNCFLLSIVWHLGRDRHRRWASLLGSERERDAAVVDLPRGVPLFLDAAFRCPRRPSFSLPKRDL